VTVSFTAKTILQQSAQHKQGWGNTADLLVSHGLFFNLRGVISGLPVV
jgi:hypothetical protein